MGYSCSELSDRDVHKAEPDGWKRGYCCGHIWAWAFHRRNLKLRSQCWASCCTFRAMTMSGRPKAMDKELRIGCKTQCEVWHYSYCMGLYLPQYEFMFLTLLAVVTAEYFM